MNSLNLMKKIANQRIISKDILTSILSLNCLNFIDNSFVDSAELNEFIKSASRCFPQFTKVAKLGSLATFFFLICLHRIILVNLKLTKMK